MTEPTGPVGADIANWPEYRALHDKLMLTQPSCNRLIAISIEGVVSITQKFDGFQPSVEPDIPIDPNQKLRDKFK